MSIYRKQAQRVIDHICETSKMNQENVEKIFKLNVALIENRIKDLVAHTSMNGKKAADKLIEVWDASHPDYVYKAYPIVHEYKEGTFRMKVQDREIIIFFAGPHGDFLHSYKYAGQELTQDLKDQICEEVVMIYFTKVKQKNS
jgi:hypothetical protein